MLEQDLPTVRRIWTRQVGDERIGVDVIYPAADIEAVARHLVTVWQLSPNDPLQPTASGGD